MAGQEHFWSAAARNYEADFIDPYRADVRNPLPGVLLRLARRGYRVVGDLGCGIGPLLPFLSKHFEIVHAVDFAPGMLDRARERCAALKNVTFHELNLTDLSPLAGRLDVAVSVNSLVMPDVRDAQESLNQFRTALRPGGRLLAIVPAMDAVHYATMLLLDRALAAGLPPAAARKNAAYHGEHALYDFAFGQFKYQGLEQHFWQPFEIRHRFARAGFGRLRLAKVRLSWAQFACGNELKDLPPPWDWFVAAR